MCAFIPSIIYHSMAEFKMLMHKDCVVEGFVSVRWHLMELNRCVFFFGWLTKFVILIIQRIVVCYQVATINITLQNGPKFTNINLAGEKLPK